MSLLLRLIGATLLLAERTGTLPRGEFAMSLAISLSKWIVLVVDVVAGVEVS